MGVFGGKMSEDGWSIETNNIDTGKQCNDDKCKIEGKYCEDTIENTIILTTANESKEYESTTYMDDYLKHLNDNNKPINSVDDSIYKPNKLKAQENTQGKHVFLNKKYQLYKTEMCRSYTEMGNCRYGDKCQFAHNESELRHVQRHPKYKTETCKTFWEEGSCPYGKRCCFIHVCNTSLDLKILFNDYKLNNEDQTSNNNKGDIIESVDTDDDFNEFLSDIETSDLHIKQKNNILNCDDFLNQIKKYKTSYYFLKNSENSTFSPHLAEDLTYQNIQDRRPFWEENDANIWMDNNTSLFFINGICKNRDENNFVCQSFNKESQKYVPEGQQK